MKKKFDPFILTDVEEIQKKFRDNEIQIHEVSTRVTIEKFLEDNWIENNQEIIYISNGNSKSLQTSTFLEKKIREFGGNPTVKISDFHTKMQIRNAKSKDECMKIVGKMKSKRQFPLHINPLTMELKEVHPKYFLDSTEQAMLYETGVHFLYGKPGSMKSWFSQQFLTSHDVRYIDLENMYSLLKKRLLLLGVQPENGYAFDKPKDAAALRERVAEYVATKPEIVVFDSLSKILSLVGAKQDSNDDVNAFFTEYIDPLRNADICVVLIDHLPKDGNSDDFPIGAQAKKQNADFMYLFKKNKEGNGADLFIAKDRDHVLESRCEPGGDLHYYGQLRLEESGGVFKVEVHPEVSVVIKGKSLSANTLKLWLEIEEFVLKAEEVTKTEIRKGVSGKSSRIDDALIEMVELKLLRMKKVGSANIFSSIEKIKIF